MISAILVPITTGMSGVQITLSVAIGKLRRRDAGDPGRASRNAGRMNILDLGSAFALPQKSSRINATGVRALHLPGFEQPAGDELDAQRRKIPASRVTP